MENTQTTRTSAPPPRATFRGCVLAVAAALPCVALGANQRPAQADGASSAPAATNAAPAAAQSQTGTAAATTAAATTDETSGGKPTLDETRLTMTKWIETQQIIARERGEWQQSKDVLKGRVELVAKEVTTLDERIVQAQASLAETDRKREELAKERDQLKASTERLVKTVTAMEAEVRNLSKVMPDPVRTKLQPLFNRIPEDPANTRVSVAERFQNVLGILNEVNKVNSEMSINFEVRTMPDGSSAECQVLYVGLGQAYYLSPRGDAGIGRPTADGWKWESAPASADGILKALEILQGKHTPAFVPLPVKIQ